MCIETEREREGGSEGFKVRRPAGEGEGSSNGNFVSNFGL